MKHTWNEKLIRLVRANISNYKTDRKQFLFIYYFNQLDFDKAFHIYFVSIFSKKATLTYNLCIRQFVSPLGNVIYSSLSLIKDVEYILLNDLLSFLFVKLRFYGFCYHYFYSTGLSKIIKKCLKRIIIKGIFTNPGI